MVVDHPQRDCRVGVRVGPRLERLFLLQFHGLDRGQEHLLGRAGKRGTIQEFTHGSPRSPLRLTLTLSWGGTRRSPRRLLSRWRNTATSLNSATRSPRRYGHCTGRGSPLVDLPRMKPTYAFPGSWPAASGFRRLDSWEAGIPSIWA